MRGARPENVLLLKEDDDDRVLSRPSGRRCRHEAVECAAAHRAYLRHATRWTCAIPIIICFNLGGHGARRPGVAVGKSRTYSDAMELVMVLSLGVKRRKFACVTNSYRTPRDEVTAPDRGSVATVEVGSRGCTTASSRLTTPSSSTLPSARPSARPSATSCPS